MKDAFPAAPATFGGCVARSGSGGRSVVAVATLVDAETSELLSSHVVRVASGDTLAALVAALEGLSAPPDIVFVAGHGTAGQGHAGIAVRLGAAVDLPCVGVATDVPPGLASRTNLHDMRGAFTPLRDGGEQVGWLLRTRVGAEPLVVSPGHRVAMPSAPELVMRCVRDDRLPEPLRFAMATL